MPATSGRASAEFTITPLGPFSLEEAAKFGFGYRVNPAWDGVLRLGFCVDGYHDQVGVEVHPDQTGVRCVVFGDSDVDAVRAQVARVLSLDYDGRGFQDVGRRDSIIGRLLEAAPGLRPVLFYSPYEAAAWAVISARRSARQMAGVRQKLAEAHGSTFVLAGEKVAAFPTPDQLLEVHDAPGLPGEKIARLHDVARAALAGQLDVERIKQMDPADAMADLQSIKGIGPFYSALIVIRASGLADVLPVAEPRLLGLVATLYQLPKPPEPDEFLMLAERWRPFRTWAAVLIRAASQRVWPELAEPRRGGR